MNDLIAILAVALTALALRTSISAIMGRLSILPTDPDQRSAGILDVARRFRDRNRAD